MRKFLPSMTGFEGRGAGGPWSTSYGKPNGRASKHLISETKRVWGHLRRDQGLVHATVLMNLGCSVIENATMSQYHDAEGCK